MTAGEGRIGPYEVLEELGRGAMGVVYRARRDGLERDFALKVMQADLAVAPEAVARFRREAQAAAALADHPGIVGVRDVGEADGRAYLAMDFVAGRTLEGIIDDGDLAPRDAARWIAQAARAVHHAHTRGILHRDLKPANLLIETGPVPEAVGDSRQLAGHGTGQPRDGCRVADFGLAAVSDADPQVTRLTRSGQVMGTPAYMAPEQARGERCDGRADVYALGASLYEALTAQPPFDGESTYDVLYRVLRTPPTPPRRRAPGIGRELDAIVLRCLEKDPELRFPDALALAEDLERYLAGEAVRTRSPGPVTRGWRWARRHRGAVGAAVVTLAAGAAGVAWWQSTAAAEREQTVQLTAKTKEAEEAERPVTFASNYQAVELRTREPLARLVDHFYGAALPAHEVAAALAQIDAVLAEERRGAPATASDAMWRVLARGYGRRLPGEAPVAAALERAGDDPYPRLLLVRMLVADFVLAAVMPTVEYRDNAIVVNEVHETPTLTANRAKVAELTAELDALALWDSLVQGRELLAYAAAARCLVAGDWTGAVAGFGELAGHPTLGNEARMMRALGRFHLRDIEGATSDWEQLALRGWLPPVVNGAQANLALAVIARGRGEDPQPRLQRAEALVAQGLDRSTAGGSEWTKLRMIGALAATARARRLAAQGEAPGAAFGEAEAHYSALLEVLPEHGEAWLGRGIVRSAVALRTTPRMPDGLRTLGRAERDFRQAYSFLPQDVRPRLQLARLGATSAEWLQAAGMDPTSAILMSRRALQEAMVFDAHVDLTLLEAADAHRRLGELLAARKEPYEVEFEAGVAACAKLLALQGDNVPTRLRRAMLNSSWAQLQFQRGADPTARHTAAAADYDWVLQREPTHVRALLARATAALNYGTWCVRHRRAEAAPWLERCDADFTAAFALRPGGAPEYNKRGNARLVLGQLARLGGGDPAAWLQGAAADFTQVAKLAPRHRHAHFNLGLVLKMLGRPAESLAALEEAARRNPRDPRIAAALAQARRAAGK